MVYNSVVEILATESYVDNLVSTSESNLEANGLTTNEQASQPSTPASGLRRIYAKSDGVYELGSDGTEYKLVRQTDQDDLENNIPLRSGVQIYTAVTNNNDGTFVTLSRDSLVFGSIRGDADGSNVQIYARLWSDSDQGDENDLIIAQNSPQGFYDDDINFANVFRAGTSIRYRGDDASTSNAEVRAYVFPIN